MKIQKEPQTEEELKETQENINFEVEWSEDKKSDKKKKE